MSPDTPDLQRAPDDLFARLRAAADEVAVEQGALEDVRSRGRRHRNRRRGGLAGAGAVLGAALLLGVPSAEVTPTPVPEILDQPDRTPGEEGGEAPAPTPAPTDGSRFGREPGWPAERTPIPSWEWRWSHVRYADGIDVHGAFGSRQLQHPSVGRVLRALVVPGVGVAHQLDPEDDPTGSIWIVRSSDESAARVATEGEDVRLLAWRGSDNDLWWTARVPGPEGSEQFLFRHDLDDGRTDRVGRSGGVESGIDALAFAGDGITAAWLSCHLQCTAWVGTLDQLVAGDGSARMVTSGWYSALDLTPDGLALGLVEHGDPTLDPDGVAAATLVPVEAPEAIRRYPLPRDLPWDTSRIQFTPDRATLLVGDDAGAWVVAPDVDGGSVRELVGDDGGAAIDPTAEPLHEDTAWAGEPGDHGPAAWPLAGADAWQWTVDEGRPDDQGWRTQPVEVAAAFVEAAALVEDGAAWSVRGVGGTDGTVVTASWVDVEVEGVPRHRIHVTSFEASPYQWVTRIEALTAQGEPADGDQLYWSYTRRGEELGLSGRWPAEGRVEVDVLAGEAFGAELRLDGFDAGAWSWSARAEPGVPVSVVVRDLAPDGRVLAASVFVFPPGDGAAG